MMNYTVKEVFMLKEKINDYLNDPKTQSLATATLQSYSFALNDLQQFCDKYEITRMEEVEETLPRLAKSYRSRGISEQSIAYKFTCIKIFLKWAGFPSQYTFSISNTGKKAFKLKHARRWLSEEEIAQCRGYQFASTTTPLRNRLIVSLLIDTGCRARELSTLKGSDVELEKGTLFLERQQNGAEAGVLFAGRLTSCSCITGMRSGTAPSWGICSRMWTSSRRWLRIC